MSAQVSIFTLAEIRTLIAEEEALADDVLHLTANEALLSPFAQRLLSSTLYNRYLLEHLDMRQDSPSRLGNFLFRGLDRINALERSATDVCRELFGAEYVEFRCLSGLHAMQTTFASLTRPGEKIMRVGTKDGGHFLTELICKLFGRESCTYVFDSRTRQIDLEQTRRVFQRERPHLLYIDAMNYLFPFPLRELREIVGDVPIIFDGSHTLGLIAGGQFQDPLREGVDILQANTHKTFFGPQKGVILGNNRQLMERISYALSNGLVSSQHTASTLALFIALHEAFYYGRQYAARVVEHARYLAAAMHRRGLPVLAVDQGFTRNHMFFIDMRPLGPGPFMLDRLLRAHISANRTIPFEHVDAIRIGVQEVTRRGYTLDDLDRIADWCARLLLEGEAPETVRPEVVDLVRARRRVLYCDETTAAPVVAAPPRIAVAGPRIARWVKFDLERAVTAPDEQLFRPVGSLGQMAGEFEHQTDSAGNISFRWRDRLYVSISGTYIKDLATHDFAEILGYENDVLRCRGSGPPSAESFMHYLVLKRVNAGVIVHNHYIPGEELAGLDVVVIPPKEYGSVELAEAVAEACTRGRIVYVRKHGMVFWGPTVEECRALLAQFIHGIRGNPVMT